MDPETLNSGTLGLGNYEKSSGHVGVSDHHEAQKKSIKMEKGILKLSGFSV